MCETNNEPSHSPSRLFSCGSLRPKTSITFFQFNVSERQKQDAATELRQTGWLEGPSLNTNCDINKNTRRAVCTQTPRETMNLKPNKNPAVRNVSLHLSLFSLLCFYQFSHSQCFHCYRPHKIWPVFRKLTSWPWSGNARCFTRVWWLSSHIRH